MKLMNNNIDEILNELGMNAREKQIFHQSIKETKYAQINDEIDAKSTIIEMIREEYKQCDSNE